MVTDAAWPRSLIPGTRSQIVQEKKKRMCVCVCARLEVAMLCCVVLSHSVVSDSLQSHRL